MASLTVKEIESLIAELGKKCSAAREARGRFDREARDFDKRIAAAKEELIQAFKSSVK